MDDSEPNGHRPTGQDFVSETTSHPVSPVAERLPAAAQDWTTGTGALPIHRPVKADSNTNIRSWSDTNLDPESHG